MKCRLFITAIVKFKEIVTSKVNQIFSSITIIVFSALMLIQIIAIISNYFDFETVTRFDVQEMKLIPNVIIGFSSPPRNLSKLYEKYSQMDQEIKETSKFRETLKEAFKNSEFSANYQKYLMQLLIDNRLNDFLEISKTNNFIKSCQIKIFDEIELKNCTPGESGIEIWFSFNDEYQ
jgi:hypothetical protein